MAGYFKRIDRLTSTTKGVGLNNVPINQVIDATNVDRFAVYISDSQETILKNLMRAYSNILDEVPKRIAVGKDNNIVNVYKEGLFNYLGDQKDYDGTLKVVNLKNESYLAVELKKENSEPILKNWGLIGYLAEKHI